MRDCVRVLVHCRRTFARHRFQTIGTGNVYVDSNLILGNHAQGGSGGGLRLQQVNDADFSRQSPNGLWPVSLTNNMITNNIAGLAGGSVSVADTTNSSIINNTIASNDSTSTAVYRVLDANKAKALNDKKAQPFLVDEATGAKLFIPEMEKVGSYGKRLLRKLGAYTGWCSQIHVNH